MAWIDLWGWLCALVGSLVSIPQLVRLLRVGTSTGLSLLMWQLNAAAMASWVVHGVRVGAGNIALSNAVSAGLSVAVLRMVRTDRGLSRRRVWMPVLGVWGGLAAVEVLAPAELFGSLVTLPFAVGLLSQFGDLLRDPDITGVSASYLGLTLLIQGMWLSWGLAVHETAITICSLVLGVLALLDAACYLARRTHLLQVRP